MIRTSLFCFLVCVSVASAIDLKQSQTVQPLEFFMADSASRDAGKTGLTPVVKLSKNGGSGASPSGTVSEIDATNHPGWYKVAGNATDTNTLGPLILTATATGAINADVQFNVVAYDPQDATRLGLATLPNAAAEASGGLITRGSSTGQLNVSGGIADANTKQFNGSNATAASGRPEVNMTHVAGSTVSTSSAQIGANTVSYASGKEPVLNATAGRTLNVSAGGAADANLVSILATALTETAGQLAGGFKKFFNIATPQATMDHGILVDTATTAGSVTGNVGGNVAGTVGSVTGSVGSVTGAVGSVTGRVTANVDQIGSASLATHATGMMPSDVRDFGGSAGTFGSGVPTVLISSTTVNDIRDAVLFTGDISTETDTTLLAGAINGMRQKFYDLAIDATTGGVILSPTGLGDVRTTMDEALGDFGLIDAAAKLNLMIEGTTPNFKFTTLALENGPSGGGGGGTDWTTTEKAQIRYRLGLDGTPNTPSATPTLPVTLASGVTVTLNATQPNYAPAKAGDAMALTSPYDAAKSASSASSVAALGSPMQSNATVTLAASQPNYAPAKPGDAMTLSGAQRVKLDASQPDYAPATAAAAASIQTTANGVKLATDKIDSMIEDPGPRWKAKAMTQTPRQ